MKTNHPTGLYYLFLTEMWERFSYYGITAILILYMNKTFAISNDAVYAIYGAYGALIYTTPLIGGLIADRVLGSYQTVIIGIWLIAIGHFVVAVQSTGFGYFYIGLAIIIVGTGLFSPNINAIVGNLYTRGDGRRDSGFTLAYMGRNIGTIIAPIACAWIAAQYDWHWAFIVAGIGMFIGLFTFTRGKRHFNALSFKPSNPMTLPAMQVSLLVALVAAVVIIDLMLIHVQWVGYLLLLAVVTTVTLLLMITRHETPVCRRQVKIAIALTAFYIVFMILLQQSGGALNLFTDSNVNRRIGSWTIETGMFQSVEPLALVLLSPLYNKMWFSLSKRDIHLSDALKFTIALVVMASSFMVMALAMFFVDKSTGLIAMTWINVTYLLQAASELFIGPIGLAMITRLVPAKIVGLFFGFWVMGSAIANFIAAKIGAWITPVNQAAAHGVQAIAAYQSAFLKLASLGIFAAIILAILLPKLSQSRG